MGCIHFSFPNLKDLIVTRYSPEGKILSIQKAGHVLSFGVLFVLHIHWKKKLGTAIVLTVICAAFSEILQLQRSGRLFDIGVNMIGIGFAYCFASQYGARHQAFSETFFCSIKTKVPMKSI